MRLPLVLFTLLFACDGGTPLADDRDRGGDGRGATGGDGDGAPDEIPEPPSDLRWMGATPFERVYDSRPRYINDHTIIQGADGTWHMIGITGPQAPAGVFPDSNHEDSLAHATAPALSGPWTTQPDVLTTDPGYFGEVFLWAPHVIEHEGTYYMFYAAGPWPDGAINLATSTDLYTWTRRPEGPLFRDVELARDAFVTRIDGTWFMYYCATESIGGRHIVAYRTSDDLHHWSERHIAYADGASSASSASVTESPVVVQDGGWWYLLIGPRGGYVGTDVFRSRDPRAFSPVDFAGHLPGHAAELIRDGDAWWASAAGSFQDGVYLAEVEWSTAPRPWHGLSNPTIAEDEAGRLRLYAASADGSALLERIEERGALSPWQTIGAHGAAPPAAVNDASGALHLFAIAADGALATAREAGGELGAWQEFGRAAATPAVILGGDGRLHAFALGVDDRVRHRVTGADGGWGEWQDLGGPFAGPPVVGRSADGRLELFVLETGSAGIAHRWELAPGGGFSDWTPFGGPAGSSPVIGTDAAGRLHVFAVNPVSVGISYRAQVAPSSSWGAWQSFSGWTGSPPTVVTNADGRLEVFRVGAGGDFVEHRYQHAPGGAWSAWQRFGDGGAACPPSAYRARDGRIRTFTVAPGGDSLRAIDQVAPNQGWAAPVSLEGEVGGLACGVPT